MGYDVEESLQRCIEEMESDNERLGDELKEMERTVERLSMSLTQVKEANAALRSKNSKLKAAAVAQDTNARKAGAKLVRVQQEFELVRAHAKNLAGKSARALVSLSICDEAFDKIVALCLSGSFEAIPKIQQIAFDAKPTRFGETREARKENPDEKGAVS